MSLLHKINFMVSCILMSVTNLAVADLTPVEGTPTLTDFPARVTEEPSSTRSISSEIVPLAKPQALSDEQAKALLGRLPALPSTDAAPPFALRPSSEPPPKAGETLQQVFPPPATTATKPQVVTTGVLSVTRYAPQGEVKTAQQISISFNRPMVAVSTQNQTTAESVPVQMTPTVEGVWRWAGTQTLLFEAKGGARLPMATDYKLSVPATTKAADGSALAKPLAWSFSTPTLKLEQSYPSGESVALNPLLFVSFNQQIESQALLPFIQVEVNGNPVKVRLAAEDEIKAETELDAWVKQALPAQFLALKLEQSLPPNAKVQVKLAAKAPSAEGPRLAAAQSLYAFKTYAPLALVEKRCGYDERCLSFNSFDLQFNNALAPKQALEQLIEISPKPASFTVQSDSTGIWIRSRWQANNTYTVTLPAELRDIYGQTLGRKQSFSFKIDKSPASLSTVNKPLITLDPNMPAELPLYSTNFKTAKVTIQRVQPRDWPAYIQLLQLMNNGQFKAPFKLPGQPLSTQQLTIKEQADALVTTPIELASWLNAGKLGQLLVLIEPGSASVKPRPIDGPPQPLLVWVQGTQLGLDAYAYNQQLLAWAGDLSTGKPLDKVSLSLHSSDSTEVTQQSTDAEGLATVNYLPAAPASTHPNDPNPLPSMRWLEAKRGDDVALLPESEYIWPNQIWQQSELNSQWLWYVLDDRHLYRPTEQVHIKGWLRTREAAPASPLLLPKDLSTVNYEVMDSAGNKIAEGSTKLMGLGGFALDFKLPATPNLGSATLNFSVPTSAEPLVYGHSFEIQEFRTPEFEVKAELTKAGPYIGNDAIHLAATASYYAGGGLATAPINWSLNAQEQTYTPPNQDEWSFGFVQPYWMRWWTPPTNQLITSFQSKTDSEGRQQLLIQPELAKYPLPLSVKAEARVSDVNRQEWVASSQWLIHPAATYVGLKTDSYFVEQNKPFAIQLLTVDIEGKVVANNPIVVEAGLVDKAENTAETQLTEVQRCQVQSDAQGLAKCEFKTAKAGQYQITATTIDQAGRRNASRINRWVSGDTELEPSTATTLEAERIQLIADKESYAPNETAKLLIQAPFKDAEGLLLVNHNGLVSQQRFSMQGNSHTLELALKAEWLPNVQVQIELNGKAPRLSPDKSQQLPERPAFATGELSLSISKAERVLTVQVAPEKAALAPAEETAIHVTIQNQQGQPVANAEVALIVVDEAILAAGDYKLADPLDSFYRLVEGSAQLRSSRESVLLPMVIDLNSNPIDEAANMGGNAMLSQAAPAAAPIVASSISAKGAYRGRIAADANKMQMFESKDQASAANAGINLRTNFNPLAAFVPSLVTDAQGKATASIKLPDNLTRYRIMAVAAQDATHYGKGESQLTARKELMVRPSAPRFLNFGDSFELPVVLQNQTDQALAVQVALDATNLELTAAKGYSVEVPANDRVEVRFPAKTINAGQVHYQIAAAANQLNDAAIGSLPVWTPATSEAFATYGVVDQGAISQAIETPKAVIPQFGQLEVTTSSTALQSLTDAYIYLQNYPFSCSEQVASRVLSTSALKDVLQAFKAKNLPSPEAIQQSMERDLALLAQRQLPEGGFRLWDSSERDWPYASVHVIHALLQAKEKGYSVNEDTLQNSLNYLRSIEQQLPNDYSRETRQYITAYSLYVRQLAGDQNRVEALALIKRAGGANKLPTEALGWLLSVLAGDDANKPLLRELTNRGQTTGANGWMVTSDLGAANYWVMHSKRAANGIVLDAFIKAQPLSDLIPLMVKSLQTEQTQGHWGTTQDNVFILLALDKYFQKYEAQTPDFVAKAWLGNDFAGEHVFKGRSTDSMETEIPMAWLLSGEQRRDLVLDKQGEGRLYYRIGLKYAPQSLDLAAAEQGFTVTRSYRGLDKPDDVKQNADGSWQMKAGARVEVTLTMQTNAERHHVALVDPLPAGLEAVNPALAVSAQQEPEAATEFGYRGWLGTWYEQQNMRDERVEAFASFLPEGVYTYRYIAKATTPGKFVVPPAKAEEMYAPETFGRSASAKVTVE